MTAVLLAIFTALNFFAMRLFSKVNSGITWWKVAIPVFTIIVLLTQFKAGNFGSHGGFMPYGVKALFGAIPSAGIVFAYLGFEQADQLAGEIKNPQRNLPRAIILAVLIGTAIYVLLQVVYIGALTPSLLATRAGPRPANDTGLTSGPFAFAAGAVALGWLATLLRIDAVISPFGTGLIYITSTSRVGYGLARNRYYPQVFAKVDRRGIPWVSLIFAFLFGLVFLLPFPSWKSLVGLVTSRERADVRGRAAVTRRVPPPGPGGRPPLPAAGGVGGGAARVHHRQPDHLLVRLRGALEARHRAGDRLRADRHLAWRSTRSGRRSTGSRPPGCRST